MDKVKLKKLVSSNLQCVGLALSVSCSFAVANLVGLSHAQVLEGKVVEGKPVAPRQPDLVELISLDTTLRLDIRYATSNNLVGRPVYDEARAFLQRPAGSPVTEEKRLWVDHLRRIPPVVSHQDFLGRHSSRKAAVRRKSCSWFETQSRLCGGSFPVRFENRQRSRNAEYL